MKETQLSLLVETQSIMQAAALVQALKATMRSCASLCRFSRLEIVEKMNAITLAAGVRMTAGRAKGISVDTLDKWLSPEEREHVPSLVALHIFCLALQDATPLRVWLETFGIKSMTPEDEVLRDYGQAMQQREIAANKVKQAKQKLTEVKK